MMEVKVVTLKPLNQKKVLYIYTVCCYGQGNASKDGSKCIFYYDWMPKQKGVKKKMTELFLLKVSVFILKHPYHTHFCHDKQFGIA